ncbi:MAG: flagellin lysine-N-methylase [Firmicutes bacterium]|nr:flagellin lysine-N-methylase [Bacillota bacterium]
MKIVMPCFYDEFECIADKCTCTCCKGWGINIDANTYSKYQKFDGELGELSKNCISKLDNKNEYRIILDENGFCPFLDENGLCKIVKTKGADYLSDVCTTYPRTTTNYADIYELYLTPSCPAVVEFFYKYENLYLHEETDGNKKAPNESEKQILFDSELSNLFISMIRFPEVPLWVKQYLVLRLADKIKEPYLNKDYNTVADITTEYTDITSFAEMSIAILRSGFEKNDIKYSNLEEMRKKYTSYNLQEIFSQEDYSDIESRSPEQLREQEIEFNSTVYKKIEYVLQNLCINEIYSNLKKNTGNYYLYTNIAMIFIHTALIKYCMFIYLLKNKKILTKEDQIKIIALTSRDFYHCSQKVSALYETNKDVFLPNNMLIFLRY